MKKAITLLFLAALMGIVSFARAQQPAQSFTTVMCSATACCAVPTVSNQPAPILYKAHVSNGAATTGFVQLFNAAATPAASATPLGATSWSIPTATNGDILIGEVMGMGGFTNGIQVCCSSTQATFTAGGPCGFLIQTR